MEFTKSLIKGKLIKRYKRFFVDVKLDNQVVTAHCPNTGSMKGLLDEGNEAYLLKNDDPKRKLKSIFWPFFHIGPLASYNRTLGPINRCWNHLELKILTGASHCLNMVSIRALGCSFMPEQGAI